jgi:hypothetical protein
MMSEPTSTAPEGFLILADAVQLRIERRRPCSVQHAELWLERQIMERRAQLYTNPEGHRVIPTDTMLIYYASSCVVGGYLPGEEDERQVMYLTMTEGGGMHLKADEPHGRPAMLARDNIERLLDAELPLPGAIRADVYQPPEAVDVPRPSSALPAHRPPEWDWPSFETQVRRRVHQRGLPNRSVLLKELQDLFDRKVKNPPDERTLRRYIAKWWPELEKLASEDLNGPCEIIRT